LKKLFDAKNLEKMTSHFINRPSTGVYPPHDYAQVLTDSFMRKKPTGTDQIVTMGSGSEAIENAMKAAFMWFQEKNVHSKAGGISQQYMDSSMKNEKPGTPDLTILTFTYSFHGRTLGALSATHSKPIHKVDIPGFHWPIGQFPQLKYPLNEFDKENRQEEQRCLDGVEEIIHNSHNNKGTFGPVAAILIEPIQAEGGDRHATPFFFQQLRALSKKYGVALICDEVQTGGGATGKWWAHEHWGLDDPADLVCFSKKCQAAGFYHKAEFVPKQTYRIFNTWLGDPLRAIELKTIIDVVERDNLLDVVNNSGKILMNGLQSIQQKYPNLIANIRGQGTFCAFDVVTVEKRTELQQLMRNNGIEMGVSGEKSVRLRPHLIFEEHHANIFLNTLEAQLKRL
jgi:4-aminobutyrate aminotransferase/(S)-3-amino-2-methylpropionate transaminase